MPLTYLSITFKPSSLIFLLTLLIELNPKGEQNLDDWIKYYVSIYKEFCAVKF